MALENYQEMRAAVLDPEYRRKKKESEELEMKDPNFIPRYSMVMFHPEINYSEALRRS
jgi:kynurenine 3-monooxygenase